MRAWMLVVSMRSQGLCLYIGESVAGLFRYLDERIANIDPHFDSNFWLDSCRAQRYHTGTGLNPALFAAWRGHGAAIRGP